MATLVTFLNMTGDVGKTTICLTSTAEPGWYNLGMSSKLTELRVPLDMVVAILDKRDPKNRAIVGQFKLCGCDPFGFTEEARDSKRRLRETEQPVAFLHLGYEWIGGRGQAMEWWIRWESPYGPIRFNYEGSEYVLCLEGESEREIERARTVELTGCDHG